ncbi:MAG: hypothetical protein II921_08475 [Treponema sp.]|nr:hypothetical protein [Treponema sp.]
MKKTLFFALLVLFFSVPICFSQENADEQEGEEIEIANDEESVDDTDEYYAEDDEESEEDFEEEEGGRRLPFISFIGTLGPIFTLNTDSSTSSAPSPVAFSGGLGALFFEEKPIFAELRVSFSMNYYLWDGKKARPAEVENRTATVPSFMIDVTGGHMFHFGNNYLGVAAGIGLLLRFAVLSHGVGEDDYGYTGDSSSSAKDDVSSINSWFYEGSNFFYPEAAITYYRYVSDAMKFGGELRGYFPVGSYSSGDGLDGMKVSLSVKVNFGF